MEKLVLSDQQNKLEAREHRLEYMVSDHNVCVCVCVCLWVCVSVCLCVCVCKLPV